MVFSPIVLFSMFIVSGIFLRLYRVGIWSGKFEQMQRGLYYEGLSAYRVVGSGSPAYGEASVSYYTCGCL